MIRVNSKEDYHAISFAGKEVLKIGKELNGKNAITKEKDGCEVKVKKIEVYDSNDE